MLSKKLLYLRGTSYLERGYNLSTGISKANWSISKPFDIGSWELPKLQTIVLRVRISKILKKLCLFRRKGEGVEGYIGTLEQIVNCLQIRFFEEEKKT